MAQTGYTPISIYHTTTVSAAPVAGNLINGELALNINTADFAMYAKNSAGTVIRMMNNPAGLKYPTADGSSGYALVTNGSGVLSFSAVGAGDVTLAGTQTLTNKTLTTPVIAGTPSTTGGSHGYDATALVPTYWNGSSVVQIGYLNIPQNSQSAAYTLVITDAGKHILHPSADTTARVFTIPANSSVAFPIGTAVTFVNQASGGIVTISITTDTMRLAGAGTTGSRTLAANGVATAIKLTATEWIISGTGLT